MGRMELWISHPPAVKHQKPYHQVYPLFSQPFIIYKDADANAYGMLDDDASERLPKEDAQSRRPEPYFVGRRVTSKYIGSPNLGKSFYNSCLTTASIERRNPWASLRERFPHDFINLAPSSRPLSVQLNFFWWDFCNTLRW